jgi:hypothetical protein
VFKANTRAAGVVYWDFDFQSPSDYSYLEALIRLARPEWTPDR